LAAAKSRLERHLASLSGNQKVPHGRFAIADSLNKSVEKVIDTIRVRRESAGPAPSETADATIPEGSEIAADIPQLHLAAAVAKASEEARESGLSEARLLRPPAEADQPRAPTERPVAVTAEPV
jgi:hypothetical protein